MEPSKSPAEAEQDAVEGVFDLRRKVAHDVEPERLISKGEPGTKGASEPV